MGPLLQIYENEKQVPQHNKDIAAEFEALKAKPIERADEWTIVNLQLIIGCGCGGNTKDIHVAVPGNHPELKGDIADYYGNYVDDSNIKSIQRKYPDALVMEGHAPGGVTDSYHPGRYSRI